MKRIKLVTRFQDEKKELKISTQPDIDTLNKVNTATKCCQEISIRKIFCDTLVSVPPQLFYGR